MTANIERVGLVRRSARDRLLPGLLWIGVALGVAVAVLTIWGVAISGHEPFKQDLRARLLSPGTDGHLLGTDRLGRDLFARVADGFRWSVPVAVVASLIAITIGTTVGLLAGWREGWVRNVLSRFMDVAISFPYLVLAVAIIAVAGHGFWALTLVLGLVAWVSFARVVFAETMAIKKREYITAARLLGIPSWRIVSTYVLRALRPTLTVMFAFIFADLLVAEAGLSFLGLGAPLGEPSWGNMLADSQANLFDAPWMMYAPAAAVVMTVLAANLIGDGLIQHWSRGQKQK